MCHDNGLRMSLERAVDEGFDLIVDLRGQLPDLAQHVADDLDKLIQAVCRKAARSRRRPKRERNPGRRRNGSVSYWSKMLEMDPRSGTA